MSRPLYIFDLDGTLANCQHRVTLLNTDDPNRWRKFYAACDLNTPIHPVINIFDALWADGYEC